MLFASGMLCIPLTEPLVALPYLTLLVAATVAWIGYHQYALAKARFKLDLFEKRFAIYKATEKFLSSSASPSRDDLAEFRRDTRDALFLFSDDIVKYLEEIGKAGNYIVTAEALLESSPIGDARTDAVNKQAAEIRKLVDKFDELTAVFTPYLRFDRWR